MAGGRTGVGVGMGVTVALLGITTLALFVLTFIFLGQKQTAQRALEQYRVETADVVKENERNSDALRRLADEARKDGGKSLYAYMNAAMSRVAERVSGSAGDTPQLLLTKINGALGESGNLIAALGERDATKVRLERELADAKAAAERARQDMQSAVDRVAALEASHAARVRELTASIDTYSKGIDKDTEMMLGKVTEMQQTIARLNREAGEEKTAATARINRLNDQLRVAEDKIRQLQRDRSKEALRPGDEAALVDGEVVTQPAADGTVMINRGARQHIVLGMTFEVYPEAGAIRATSIGEYPRGKASLEVIRVDETTSQARVTRNLRGNPVTRGDVIANALYDPAKKYTFLVYGNFDSGSGRPSQQGQAAVKALIEEWGGKVTESLTGDVDFVVLGSRPVMPPTPASDAPIAVVEEYIRQRQIAERYDQLLAQATATSIPVLNQNRLITLTGKSGS